MKIALNLTLKRKWFDMIASGEKREEYRDCENRQAARLYSQIMDGGIMPDGLVAIFRNGYRLDSRAIAVELVGMDLRDRDTAKHPEWGEPVRGRPHFAVKLGRVLSIAAYKTVRDIVKEAENGK